VLPSDLALRAAARNGGGRVADVPPDRRAPRQDGWVEHAYVTLEEFAPTTEFRLLDAFDVVAPPGWTSDPEDLAYSEVWLIRSGSCTVTTPRGRLCAGPGQAVVLAPGDGTIAGNAADEPLSITGFGFAVLAFGVADLTPRLGLPLVVENASAALVGLVEDVTRAVLAGGLDRAFRARPLAELAFAELVAVQAETAGGPAAGPLAIAVPPEVRRVLALVAERYAEPLEPAALAAEVHLSPKYLARRFREAVGIPPMAYVRHYRLARAHELLAGSDAPITQIALGTGFSDHAHFSRAFRKRYGLTPRAARARARSRSGGRDGAATSGTLS
jgi:AraC-like DNA-binding protein